MTGPQIHFRFSGFFQLHNHKHDRGPPCWPEKTRPHTCPLKPPPPDFLFHTQFPSFHRDAGSLPLRTDHKPPLPAQRLPALPHKSQIQDDLLPPVLTSYPACWYGSHLLSGGHIPGMHFPLRPGYYSDCTDPKDLVAECHRHFHWLMPPRRLSRTDPDLQYHLCQYLPGHLRTSP